MKFKMNFLFISLYINLNDFFTLINKINYQRTFKLEVIFFYIKAFVPVIYKKIQFNSTKNIKILFFKCLLGLLTKLK